MFFIFYADTLRFVNRHMVNTTVQCPTVDIFFQLFLVYHDDDVGRSLCYSALVTLCNLCKASAHRLVKEKHRPVDIRHPARRRLTFQLQTTASARTVYNHARQNDEYRLLSGRLLSSEFALHHRKKLFDHACLLYYNLLQ